VERLIALGEQSETVGSALEKPFVGGFGREGWTYPGMVDVQISL
jgi:hypothetical protein